MPHSTTSNFNVRTPVTQEDFRRRDQMLEDALWEDSHSDHSIADEYPLVLPIDKSEFSHCFYQNNVLVAHANLLPREVISSEGKIVATIGLVGNVVTAPQFRGRGYMRDVFRHLTSKSQEMGLQALLLWSDLNQFYQKLGFSSLGREYRFVIQRRDLLKSHQPPQGWRPLLPGEEETSHLMDLRPSLPYTVKRSNHEWQALLTIPQTFLFVKEEHNEICAFLVVGRGHDMVQVVHEWGARNPQHLLEGLSFVCEKKHYDWLMVLSPSYADSFNQALNEQSHSCEEHAMALCQPLDPAMQAVLSQCFIWGLDSI